MSPIISTVGTFKFGNAQKTGWLKIISDRHRGRARFAGVNGCGSADSAHPDAAERGRFFKSSHQRDS
ncbi:hypothetical protein M2321_004029 [Rhodoblastus acidophilus]|nr:hypothetical protein [Rhodoblastus acidophilus]